MAEPECAQAGQEDLDTAEQQEGQQQAAVTGWVRAARRRPVTADDGLRVLTEEAIRFSPGNCCQVPGGGTWLALRAYQVGPGDSAPAVGGERGRVRVSSAMAASATAGSASP